MKPVIYQLVVRYFGNVNLTNQADGSIGINGCGKFNDINTRAVQSLKDLGATHIWLTGVLRQATLTNYSTIGMPADDPDIVKGVAGSFYAVRDYYDVCPDYAVDPRNRMQEFQALVQRIQASDLQVLIDFVPNHVSRGYQDLGHTDDQTQFFSPANNFFYLADPPRQSLQLSKPVRWNPPGFSFDGRFTPEDGTPGHTPKATGNNIVSPAPSANDWYETIKLNYGYNFVTQAGIYSPEPKTWADVDAILAFWQSKGVDGFRCDFAHYVPTQAWTFLIAQARQRRPAYFFAEAYPWQGSGDPVQNQQALIDSGFDALYFYQSYNRLKGVYTAGNLSAYDNELTAQPTSMRPHLAAYLENHDERRIPSPIVSSGGSGDSGFGSADAGYQLAPLQFLYSSGPVLFLNGQEAAETGAGTAGFSGEDGRTTIYDYWTMPEFAKWVNRHSFDGALLSPGQLALRNFYAALLALCQNRSIQSQGFWSLRYLNPQSSLYAYVRFEPGSAQALLIVANFQPGSDAVGQIKLPADLCAAIGLNNSVTVTLILTRQGALNTFIASLSADELAQTGFSVQVPNQTTYVYSVSA